MRLLSSLWSVNITRIEPAGTQVRPLELCWLMKTLAVSLRCSHIDIWCLCIDTISVHKNILISYCYDILINIWYEYFKLCTNKIRIKYPTFIQVYSHIAYMGIYLFIYLFFEEVSDDYPDELEKTIKNQKHTHSHTNHSTLCLAAVLYLRTGICGGGIDFTQSDHVWLLIWIFLCYCYIFSEPLNFGLSTISMFFFSAFFFFPLAGGSRELTMHFTLNWEYVAMVVARDLA